MLFDLSTIPPRLLSRDAPTLLSASPRRTKIWEFNTNLHCSIIATCLSNSELRQTLKKVGIACQGCTDHELHGIAVGLARRHDNAARHLHKALDHRHKLVISQFAKADTEAAVRTMWQDAVRRGDIPGAYWATLIHKLTTQAIVREAFGEVHMLSHLVGSATAPISDDLLAGSGQGRVRSQVGAPTAGAARGGRHPRCADTGIAPGLGSASG